MVGIAFADGQDLDGAEAVRTERQRRDWIVAQLQLAQARQPGDLAGQGAETAGLQAQRLQRFEASDPAWQRLDLVVRQHQLARAAELAQLIGNEAQFALAKIYFLNRLAAPLAGAQFGQALGSLVGQPRRRGRADL